MTQRPTQGASGVVEKTICGDASLAGLDRQLSVVCAAAADARLASVSQGRRTRLGLALDVVNRGRVSLMACGAAA
jgi:uncharacterized protein